ncbi:MAG: PAS domain-containing protein [Thermoanaerobaculaceae bacterium]|jgi:transcriptional regulator with PAS, ATPase and Fis domain|nr:PAS domain-containing protein [Thermoanaerobaculaceae bacterium]
MTEHTILPASLLWVDELPAAVTVTDREGRITAMNRRAATTFASEGGLELLGTDVFACHPEPSRSKLKELYATAAPNHYTISKAGQKKVIHQLPWFVDGELAGFVEISIPIPETLPHFDRG